MKGSITKYTVKSSSRPKWRYRLCVGKDSAGKYLYEGRGGFAKEGEARDAMRDRIVEIEAAKNAPAQPVISVASTETFGDWLRTWLKDYAKERCAPKTFERYEQLAAYLLANDAPAPVVALAGCPLANVRHQGIEAALRAILAAPAKRREHLSAKSVRHIGGLISVSLAEAWRLEKIVANPYGRVRLPTVEPSEARALTPAEVQKLREFTRDCWTFAIVEAGLGSGARRGELCALQWPDVDFATATVTISKSLEQTKNGIRVKSYPKGRRSRKFKIGQTLITALRFELDKQREHRRLYGPDYQENNLVFCQPDGSNLDPALLSQTIVRRMKSAGISDASLHLCRHTHASWLLSAGVPITEVSRRLGHADVNVTLKTYSHFMPADDSRAATAWETALQKPVPKPEPETAGETNDEPTTIR